MSNGECVFADFSSKKTWSEAYEHCSFYSNYGKLLIPNVGFGKEFYQEILNEFGKIITYIDFSFKLMSVDIL